VIAWCTTGSTISALRTRLPSTIVRRRERLHVKQPRLSYGTALDFRSAAWKLFLSLKAIFSIQRNVKQARNACRAISFTRIVVVTSIFLPLYRLACRAVSCRAPCSLFSRFASAHVKAALANTSPATATATPSATSGKGAAASTADLRESMSAAVHAIATQSAQILLHNNKVCML